MQIPARNIVACQRHQVADLPCIKLLGHETLPHRVLPRVAVALHLFLVHRDANALAAELRRIAKQLVHHRPQALLLAKQRTERVRASAAVASRCLPADDSLVDHQDIDALAREPPSRGQAGCAAADNHHGRTVRLTHLPSAGSSSVGRPADSVKTRRIPVGDILRRHAEPGVPMPRHLRVLLRLGDHGEGQGTYRRAMRGERDVAQPRARGERQQGSDLFATAAALAQPHAGPRQALHLIGIGRRVAQHLTERARVAPIVRPGEITRWAKLHDLARSDLLALADERFTGGVHDGRAHPVEPVGVDVVRGRVGQRWRLR